MAGLDDLLTQQDNTIVGDGGKFTFIDADTIRTEDGETHRLQGVNAPETAKPWEDPTSRKFSPEVGADMTTQQVYELANSGSGTTGCIVSCIRASYPGME